MFSYKYESRPIVSIQTLAITFHIRLFSAISFSDCVSRHNPVIYNFCLPFNIIIINLFTETVQVASLFYQAACCYIHYRVYEFGKFLNPLLFSQNIPGMD